MEEKLKQNSEKPSGIIKVVLYGPESTGKTSLAEALASFFNTVYVEEYARQYAEIKKASHESLTKDDVLPIAVGQIQSENEQQKKANKLLICDTDLLETMVYSKFYYNGFCPEIVSKYAQKNSYDLYFLTYIDTPWEADGIRDLPHSRLQMFTAFEQALIDFKKNYILVKGSFEERLDLCKTHIQNLLNAKV